MEKAYANKNAESRSPNNEFDSIESKIITILLKLELGTATGSIPRLLIVMPHLHIRASGEANSEANDEQTITYSPRHLLGHLPRHSWRSHSKRLFEHESKGTNCDLHYVYEHVNQCSYACENSSFAQRQRHTNVRASGEVRHEHERVNAVLDTRVK